MFKAIDKWFPGYLRSLLSRPVPVAGTRHLIFCVCDHFEPFRDGVDADTARQTVSDWLAAYPAAADSFRDADGHPPRHTFFYPQEEYDPAILDSLAAFCRRGFGEVEIHLHHRHDTPDGLRDKLITFRDLLHEKHGLLGVEEGILPRRYGGVEGEKKEGENVVRSFQMASTPFEKIAQHPSGGGGDEPFDKLRAGDGDKCAEHNQSSGFSLWNILKERCCGNLRRSTRRLQFPQHSLPAPTSSLPQPLRISVVESSPVRYAFIHGNWSLCNSRPDGDWCGVNEELGILAETGCYADFTFPSAPSPTQPRMVNALYYASDIPGKPRGADKGEVVGVRVQGSGHKESEALLNLSPLTPEPRTLFSPLLLITGPLALNWRRRKWGILPRLENAEIAGGNPPTPDRIRLWARQQIGVAGRPDWVFVKVHTHGCVPGNARVLLGESMRQAHEVLQREFNDGQNWQLHYVTAREMHNLVKAAESNLPGSPNQYRDTPIAWPV